MPLAFSRKRKIKGGEREGGEGSDPTLKNTSELMSAVKSRCWRQNFKVVAQRTKRPSKTKSNCSEPADTGSAEAEERERQRRR
jgi:hypothetical protein